MTDGKGICPTGGTQYLWDPRGTAASVRGARTQPSLRAAWPSVPSGCQLRAVHLLREREKPMEGRTSLGESRQLEPEPRQLEDQPCPRLLLFLNETISDGTYFFKLILNIVFKKL